MTRRPVARAVRVGLAPVVAARISYLGELGRELYVPQSLALHVWDSLWEAGRAFDMPAVDAQTVLCTHREGLAPDFQLP